MKNLIAATYAPMHPNGAIAPEVIGQYANFLKKIRYRAFLLMVPQEILHRYLLQSEKF